MNFQKVGSVILIKSKNYFNSRINEKINSLKAKSFDISYHLDWFSIHLCWSSRAKGRHSRVTKSFAQVRKVGCVFPMTISTEFRLGQYRDDPTSYRLHYEVGNFSKTISEKTKLPKSNKLEKYILLNYTGMIFGSVIHFYNGSE